MGARIAAGEGGRIAMAIVSEIRCDLGHVRLTRPILRAIKTVLLRCPFQWQCHLTPRQFPEARSTEKSPVSIPYFCPCVLSRRDITRHSSIQLPEISHEIRNRVRLVRQVAAGALSAVAARPIFVLNTGSFHGSVHQLFHRGYRKILVQKVDCGIHDS